MLKTSLAPDQLKVAIGPNLSTNKILKQIITNRMYENCHISASMALRNLKIGRERGYTIIYHRMDLFLSRSNYVSNNMARNRAHVGALFPLIF